MLPTSVGSGSPAEGRGSAAAVGEGWHELLEVRRRCGANQKLVLLTLNPIWNFRCIVGFWALSGNVAPSRLLEPLSGLVEG